MPRMNDFSDREAARDLCKDMREALREWAEKPENRDADSGDAQEFIEETADSMVTNAHDVWMIVHNFDLEDDEPQVCPDVSTPYAFAERLAYEHLVSVGEDEWGDIELDREDEDEDDEDED